MRLAVLLAVLTLSSAAIAEQSSIVPPISRADTAEITRIVSAVTHKSILFIVAASRDKPFPGAVVRYDHVMDVKTGKQTRVPQYLRRDLVYVYMKYTDRSHVDVYAVRKVRGHWRLAEKKNWFI